MRHDRDTLWPICEPEDWMSKHMTPIRHQLDDMPMPYNYTGIDENLNGFFTANETTTPLFFDDSSCDKVDGSENNEVTQSLKSKPLPIFHYFLFRIFSYLDQHTKPDSFEHIT